MGYCPEILGGVGNKSGGGAAPSFYYVNSISRLDITGLGVDHGIVVPRHLPHFLPDGLLQFLFVHGQVEGGEWRQRSGWCGWGRGTMRKSWMVIRLSTLLASSSTWRRSSMVVSSVTMGSMWMGGHAVHPLRQFPLHRVHHVVQFSMSPLASTSAWRVIISRPGAVVVDHQVVDAQDLLWESTSSSTACTSSGEGGLPQQGADRVHRSADAALEDQRRHHQAAPPVDGEGREMPHTVDSSTAPVASTSLRLSVAVASMAEESIFRPMARL